MKKSKLADLEKVKRYFLAMICYQYCATSQRGNWGNEQARAIEMAEHDCGATASTGGSKHPPWCCCLSDSL